MVPTIQIRVDEAGFGEVALGGAGGEVGDGVRLAQGFWLEEMIGLIFGAVALWYVVGSLAGLA